MLLWQSWRARADEASEKRGEAVHVRWVLDNRARHCEDCLMLAAEYDSYDQLMLASSNRVPGSAELADHGRCRCRLEFQGNSGWQR